MRKTPAAILCALTLSAALVLQEAPADAAPEPDETSSEQSTGEPEGSGAQTEDADETPEPAEVLADPEPEASPVVADVQTTAVEPTADDGVASTVNEIDGLRVVGATWDDDGESPVQVWLRSHDGEEWSPWEDVDIDAPEEDDQTGRSGTEPMVVLEAQQVEVAVESDSDALLTSVEVSVIDPGQGAADTPMASTATATTGIAPMAMTGPPTINSRAAWGADETQRYWRPQAGRVTGAVVHHTAGVNGYSADQVPAILRGIYQFHTHGREWGDIGYNVLVDRFGRAWEGRYGGLQNAVVGAHATGSNNTMFGISVLGNYDQIEVPAAAFNMVAQVIGWKFSWHGITTAGSAIGPGGSSVNRIVGHRDVQSTVCPGRYFYPRMGELTQRVAQYQAANPPRNLPPYETIRLAGDDRYQTAVEASRWAHSRASTVFVATAEDYADALSAGSAAVAEQGPVLLVRSDRVPATVQEELRRLRPSQIYVLGGSAAISDSVVRSLQGFASVERLVGQERYQTAARIAAAFFTASSVNEVYISSGEAYADALSGGAAAARRGAPMLLTRSVGVPGATETELRRTNPSRIVLVGGTSAVNEATRAEIARIVPGATVTRVSGSNRYETSAAVAEHVWSGTSDRVYYATGLDWPDALSGASAAGASGAPLLLLNGNCSPSSVRAQTARLNLSTALVLGGVGAVANDAVARRC